HTLSLHDALPISGPEPVGADVERVTQDRVVGGRAQGDRAGLQRREPRQGCRVGTVQVREGGRVRQGGGGEGAHRIGSPISAGVGKFRRANSPKWSSAAASYARAASSGSSKDPRRMCRPWGRICASHLPVLLFKVTPLNPEVLCRGRRWFIR